MSGNTIPSEGANSGLLFFNSFSSDVWFQPEIFIAVAVSVCLSLVLFLWILKSVLKQYKQSLADELNVMQHQLKVVTSGSLGLGEKVIALESKLAELRSSQEQMQSSNVDFSYTQAYRMLEQGVNREEIIENSGLSACEIQLMSLLHEKTHQPDNDDTPSDNVHSFSQAISQAQRNSSFATSV